MQLNLLVIRAQDPKNLVRFYESLGLSFEKERHGSGPEHYASTMGDLIFEIYPQQARDTASSSVRIGFRTDTLAAVLAQAIGAGAVVVSPMRPGPWGNRAVITDPEGNAVELIEPGNAATPRMPAN